jgi:hypothetical protein
MKKVVKLTESELENIVKLVMEQSSPIDYLFKSEYIPEDKSIIASYYVLGETDKFWDVLNIIEKEDNRTVWADDAKVYRYYPRKTKLPKSQVQQSEEIGNTGFFVFRIPYWLYRKDPSLEIKRIEGKKRFLYTDFKTGEDVVGFDILEPVLLALGADPNKVKSLGVNLHYQKNPKPKDTPTVNTQVQPFNITKKSGPERFTDKNLDNMNESSNLDDYDELDFSDAFFTVFKQWLNDSHPEAPSKAPLSYYIKKYGSEFADTYEISQRLIPYRSGMELVRNGVFTLGSMRPEVKFTEKYEKTIPWLTSQFKNEYTDIEIKEDEPYNLDVTLIYDIPQYFKTDDTITPLRNQKNSFINLLETYFGVDTGSPELGELKVKFNSFHKDEETWIKKEFTKLKKEIRKEFPAIQRIVIKTSGSSPSPDVSFYRDYRSSNFRDTNVDRIREFFEQKGYGKALTQGFYVR